VPDRSRSSVDSLAGAASTLLRQAAVIIAESRAQTQRSEIILHQSREHVAWSTMLIEASIALRDELRGTIAALVCAERASGVPPERMLAMLKGLALDAVDASAMTGTDARSLIDDVVRWGIEAYYAA
jgi:hypothetical protein